MNEHVTRLGTGIGSGMMLVRARQSNHWTPNHINWAQRHSSMKGIVFREFMEMVEATFGEEMLEALIAENDLPSGGVYTAVGTYDHQELVAMAITLSERTGLPVEALVEAFGNYLFGRFLELFPVFFNHESSFAFLDTVHDVVHVEVLKLYPDATLQISQAKSGTMGKPCTLSTTARVTSQIWRSVS